jgi:CheY-like chemotaxis protein
MARPPKSKPTPPARTESAPGHRTTQVPHEVAQAWVQFMRDDVAASVNGLNNRLNAILGAVSEISEANLRRADREQLQHIRDEVARAVNITSNLLKRVDAMSPSSVPHLPAAADAGDSASAAPRPGSILVVEDDDANRAVIVRLLQRMGHYVTPCANGLEALEILKLSSVDCIVCDLRMPVLGGVNFFQQVENLMPNVASRFVFVTGDYTDPGSRNFLEETGQPVIGKPYDVAELLAAVGVILRRVQAVPRTV